MSEPKVTECWTIKHEDGRPSSFVSGAQEEVGFLAAVLMWKEDYDALIKERELNVTAIHELQAMCDDVRNKYVSMRRELEELRVLRRLAECYLTHFKEAHDEEAK